MFFFLIYFSSCYVPSTDAASSKLQASNVFTIAKRTVEGQDMLYQSMKLTNGIWVLAELKGQAGSPNYMVRAVGWAVVEQWKLETRVVRRCSLCAPTMTPACRCLWSAANFRSPALLWGFCVVVVVVVMFVFLACVLLFETGD